jgi:hypothetical protein
LRELHKPETRKRSLYDVLELLDKLIVKSFGKLGKISKTNLADFVELRCSFGPKLKVSSLWLTIGEVIVDVRVWPVRHIDF